MCPIKKYIMLSCKIKILKKSESINDAKIPSIIFAFLKLYVCKFKIYTKGSILDNTQQYFNVVQFPAEGFFIFMFCYYK